MFGRFDRIPACDRQTDRRTSCDSIVRTMHAHRAVSSLAACDQHKADIIADLNIELSGVYSRAVELL